MNLINRFLSNQKLEKNKRTIQMNGTTQYKTKRVFHHLSNWNHLPLLHLRWVSRKNTAQSRFAPKCAEFSINGNLLDPRWNTRASDEVVLFKFVFPVVDRADRVQFEAHEMIFQKRRIFVINFNNFTLYYDIIKFGID